MQQGGIIVTTLNNKKLIILQEKTQYLILCIRVTTLDIILSIGKKQKFILHQITANKMFIHKCSYAQKLEFKLVYCTSYFKAINKNSENKKENIIKKYTENLSSAKHLTVSCHQAWEKFFG